MDLWLVMLGFGIAVICGLVAIVCAFSSDGSYPTPPRKEESYGNNVRVLRQEDRGEGREEADDA